MDSTLIPLGVLAGPFTAYCDPDEIVAFALAINDENTLYLDGRAVPPTYAVVPVFDAFRSVPPMPPGAMAGVAAEGTESTTCSSASRSSRACTCTPRRSGTPSSRARPA